MSDVAPLQARIAELEGELDLLRRGAGPADVQMVAAIAAATRGHEFTAREVGLTAAQREDLAQAISDALGDAWSVQKVGHRLTKLRGQVVERLSRSDHDGWLWQIHWPNRRSTP